MLANIRIATIVGLMAILGLVNTQELKTQKHPQVKQTKRFFGWFFKPKPHSSSCAKKPSGRVWANDWDAPMDFTCPHYGTISSMYSIWASCKRDRIWSFSCHTPFPGRHTNLVQVDHAFINEWDGPLLKMCPNDAFICGISSVHDNFKEDRRYKFRCCSVKNVGHGLQLKLINCQVQKLNHFQKEMNFHLPGNTVLTGLYSYHRDDKEDRVWQARFCHPVLVHCKSG